MIQYVCLVKVKNKPAYYLFLYHANDNIALEKYSGFSKSENVYFSSSTSTQQDYFLILCIAMCKKQKSLKLKYWWYWFEILVVYFQPPDYWVIVHNLKSSSEGAILDVDDQLNDVADDREQVSLICFVLISSLWLLLYVYSVFVS